MLKLYIWDGAGGGVKTQNVIGQKNVDGQKYITCSEDRGRGVTCKA